MSNEEDHRIVIFDGTCNFCNASVRFIAKRDPAGIFLFSPIQSDFAQQLIRQHDIARVGIDSFYLIKHGKPYQFSDAALEITRELSGAWPLLGVFRIVPRTIRDAVYRLFARNRYKLFGKTAQCVLPTEELRSRFRGI